jgi:hypothetical protein
MQIRAALEQPAVSLAPQVVHVEVHLRDLLAAAGQELPPPSMLRSCC